MDLFKTWLVEDYISHRGLHDEEAPENSLLAFEKSIKNGFPIELDVQLISDGTVVVFHDSTLARVTGKDGYVKNLKIEDLKTCFLSGSKYTIPTFEEVLNFIDGKTPILIEIKNSDKVGELESAVYSLLSKYKGDYAIQSFNPFVLKWFRLNAPNVIRGQLAGYLKEEDLSYFRKFALKRMLLNKKVSQPHFISYEAKKLPNRFVKKYKKLPLLAWTVRKQEEYLNVIKYCDNIIFENFIPKI